MPAILRPDKGKLLFFAIGIAAAMYGPKLMRR
jgi:hypothetical protein